MTTLAIREKELPALHEPFPTWSTGTCKACVNPKPGDLANGLCQRHYDQDARARDASLRVKERNQAIKNDYFVLGQKLRADELMPALQQKHNLSWRQLQRILWGKG